MLYFWSDLWAWAALTFFVRMCELNYIQMSYSAMWELYLHMKTSALCVSFVFFG